MEQGTMNWYYSLSWTLLVLSLLGLVTVGVLGIRMKLFRNRRILLRVAVSVISLAVLSLAAAVLFLLPGFISLAEEPAIAVQFYSESGEVLDTVEVSVGSESGKSGDTESGNGETETGNGETEAGDEAMDSGKYVFSGETVEAVVTIREKNPDPKTLTMQLREKRGSEISLSYGENGWNGLEGAEDGTLEAGDWTEEEPGVYTVRIRFLQEGSWRLEMITCGDLAGNQAALNPQCTVVIDRQAPKLLLEREQQDGIRHADYYNQTAEVWCYIEEEYFTQGQPPKIQIWKNGVLAETETVFWEPAAERGLFWHKCHLRFPEEGAYEVTISYTDPAGNPVSAETKTEDQFTVDLTPPDQGMAEALENQWTGFWEQVGFGHFSGTRVPVVMSGSDSLSPVEPIQYYCSGKGLSRAELDMLPENVWTVGDSLFLETGTKTVVYGKVTNYAGLWSYFSSEGIVVESFGPEISVGLEGEAGVSEPYYRSSVKAKLEIRDRGEGEAVSGLRSAGYRLNGSSKETLEQGNFSENFGGTEAFQTVLEFPVSRYEEQELELVIWAEDQAGNRTEEQTRFILDSRQPELRLEFDEAEPKNERYYASERTVVLTVKEPFFSEKQISLSITNTEGISPQIGAWSHDGAIHRLTLKFSADGEYMLSVHGTDLAGNEAELSADSFVIDQTPPKLVVEFADGGNGGAQAQDGFYAAARKAAVMVQEKNFAEELVFAEDSEKLTFQSSGLLHRADTEYEENRTYHVRFSCTDLAGNEAVWEEPLFTVDTEVPKLTVSGLTDQSANRGTVEAGLLAEDQNLRKETVQTSLLRFRNGRWKETGAEIQKEGETEDKGKTEDEANIETKVGAETGSEREIPQVLRLLSSEIFPKTEETDGLYRLIFSAVDRAGNRTERELTFSVNRFGSVYLPETETAAWLYPEDGSYPYLPEEQEVTLLEYNVDEVEEYRAAVSRDGVLGELKEGEDYFREEITPAEREEEREAEKGSENGNVQAEMENTDEEVEKEGADGTAERMKDWKCYRIRILSHVFASEGDYEIFLYSGDKAGNQMGNTMPRTWKRNARFSFSVDKTPPSVMIAGAEDGGRYRERERILRLSAWDNMELAGVRIRVGEEEQDLEGGALQKMIRENDGQTEITVQAKNDWQTVQVWAWDRAGNGKPEADTEAGTNEAEEAETEEASETETSAYRRIRLLVTPNWLVLLFRSPYRGAAVLTVLVVLSAAGWLAWAGRERQSRNQSVRRDRKKRGSVLK